MGLFYIFICYMIKLKSILESINELNDLFESPMKGAPINTNVFDDHDKNLSYVLAAKKHAKLVDKYKDYDIYRFTPTNAKNDINDVFIYGDFVSAYFNYSIFNNNYILEKKIWQDHIQLGLFRDIIFNYYLNKYKGVISDVIHSPSGEKYWKKILKQAKDSGNYEIYVLRNEKDKIPLNDLNDVDKYFTHAPDGLKNRFVIEKI